MTEQGGLPSGGELAQRARVAEAAQAVGRVQLCLAEVREQDDGELVALCLYVGLELVQGVGVVVAGVTPQLGGVGPGQHGELPLVCRAALSDVIVEGESGQVFVCLAVQLEVCLEVSLVGAELADVSPSQEELDLPLPLH